MPKSDLISSTKNKIEGDARQAKGKAKEIAGRVTGNADLADRGTVEKTVVRIQSTVG